MAQASFGSKVLQWTYKAIHSHSKIASPKWCAMFCHKILTFVSCLFGVPAQRRLDGPPDHDYGLVEKFQRCTVSTDLKTAGLWTEGSLQSCVNLTGAARNQGLCTGLYINYAAGKGCECTQDYCKDRTGDQEFSIYLASEQSTLLAYSLLQDGMNCAEYRNFRLSGLWTTGSAHACMLLATGPGKSIEWLECQVLTSYIEQSMEIVAVAWMLVQSTHRVTGGQFIQLSQLPGSSPQRPRSNLWWTMGWFATAQTFAKRGCGRSEDHSKLGCWHFHFVLRWLGHCVGLCPLMQGGVQKWNLTKVMGHRRLRPSQDDGDGRWVMFEYLEETRTVGRYRCS